MRSPSYTGQFKRDVNLAEKRGKDISKLRTVIESVLAGEPLPRELLAWPGHTASSVAS